MNCEGRIRTYCISKITHMFIYADFMDLIYEAKGKLQWLSSRDVEYAMESILDIQTTYDLDVSQVSRITNP